MNFPDEYEKYKKLSTPELAEIMAGCEEISSKANIARLVYEERQMAEKYKYEKEQIELQHKRNMELTTKQVRWIKFSAALTAIATLTAAIAGALVTYMLRTAKPIEKPRPDTQQKIQRQNSPLTLESHVEKKDEKISHIPKPRK